MTITDIIKNEPHALQPSDVYALIEAFSGAAVSIYAKHLVDGQKELVYYETPEEGLADPERYGSVWIAIDGKQGIMRLYEP